MLINTQIKITVTNDGKNNKVSTSFNKTTTFSEFFTCLEMARQSSEELIEKYIKTKYGQVSEMQFRDIYNSKTMDEISQ